MRLHRAMNDIPDFPSFVSFTITNACNLRCTMCGQWSPEGYVRTGNGYRGRALDLATWKRLADEAAACGDDREHTKSFVSFVCFVVESVTC